MNKDELQDMVERATINCFKELADNPKEFVEKYELQGKYNNILKEKVTYKQALIDIRKYINTTDTFIANDGKVMQLKDEISGQDILQIIDNVLGGSDER